MKKLASSLYVQVLLAIGAGVLLGHFYPELGVSLKPLGDAFIKSIKMIISPLIFCTVVIGIAGMEDMKKVGKTGAVALLYFEIVSTLALIIGLLVVHYFEPGVGMNIDVASLNTKDIAKYVDTGKAQTTIDFLLNLIPTTFVDAFAKGDILQVLFIAILFGFALQKCGGRDTLVFKTIDSFSQSMFGIIGMLMKVAPIGAFGAMAFTIGKFGVGSLTQLATFMATFYLTCFLFIFIVVGGIAAYSGFSIFKFLRFIKEEIFVVLGTSSSETVLPKMLEKMERLGVKKQVVGLVVPTGYSFNLDGSYIYLSMAVIFIAQATNTPLSLMQELTILGILMITSKGSAAVVGSAFIILGATLSTVGTIPVEGIAIVFGIDRFMAEARAITNLIGNGVATVAIAKWTGELDSKQLKRELS